MSPPSGRARPIVAAALAVLLAPSVLSAPAVLPTPAPARSAEPLDVLRDCAAHASAQISGVKDLEAACPGLEAAMQSLGLDRILYDGWRDRLNEDALRDVSKLAHVYGEPKPAVGPDVTALSGILKNLARDQAPAPKSWWDAFMAWLKSWLRSQDADSLSWLDRWLDRMRQSVTLLNAILYSLIGLVVIGAGWIVINELRAAGLLGRKRGRPAAMPSGRSAAAGGPANLDSEPAALADRIGALLRRLVNRLVQSGRLKSERSLTHRELVVQSAFDSEAQRAVFAEVAGSAESILYGTRGVPPERLSSVLRDGEILLAQLPDTASRG